MADRTDNFGLLALKPGDGLSAGGYAFLNDNIWKIDRLLAATVSHDHTNTGLTLADPTTAPTLALDTSSGNLPAGTTVRYRYTYVDQYGAETAAAPEASVSTAAVIQKPLAPGVLAVITGGTLLGGLYNYALTAYSGTNTHETNIGGRNNTSVPFTTATNSIALTMPAAPVGATGFNIYRRAPGEAYYAYLGSLPIANLDLPGASGDFAHTPDSTAVSVTGDIDIRCHAAADDWTPVSTQAFVGKWQVAANASYILQLESSGNLRLSWSTTGADSLTATSTVAVSFSDGNIGHVRATLDVDNGASGRDVTFYTSVDGVTWTQLGATVTAAGITSIFDGTALLTVGAYADAGTTEMFAGTIFSAQIYSGIGGTLVADFNPSADANTGDPSFVSSTGETWTIAGSAAIASSSYTDTNSVSPNSSRQPPSTNLTNSTNNVTVTLPGAVPANSTWKVYRTFISGNWEASDLNHVTQETFVGSGIITPSFLDLGNGTGLGTIPEVTEIAAVPSQISNNEVDFAWDAATWVASVSGWSLGNGTVVSRYVQLGKLVFAKITVTAGSTTTFGSALTLDLPATALAAQHLGMNGVAIDSSTGDVAPVLCQLNTTTSLTFLPLATVIQAGAGLSGTTPWTWANGDSVEALIVYEAA